ncbi:hypothetical protein [Pseudomonas sp. dw_358]|uniref:hypothetical protein n=1 Tax=Pseudomonas sp. dw_358 TaxID=2720083 RepID=UPI001BD41A29|nr:hypothetical protein [Pseudomonas sp. dw_358]
MYKAFNPCAGRIASVTGLMLFVSVAQAGFFGHDAPPDPYASAPDKAGSWSASCEMAGFTGEARGEYQVRASQWSVSITDYKLTQTTRQKVSGQSSLHFRLGNAPHGGNPSGWDKSTITLAPGGEWRAPHTELAQTRTLFGDIQPVVEFVFDASDIDAKCFAKTIVAR